MHLEENPIDKRLTDMAIDDPLEHLLLIRIVRPNMLLRGLSTTLKLAQGLGTPESEYPLYLSFSQRQLGYVARKLHQKAQNAPHTETTEDTECYQNMDIAVQNYLPGSN